MPVRQRLRTLFFERSDRFTFVVAVSASLGFLPLLLPLLSAGDRLPRLPWFLPTVEAFCLGGGFSIAFLCLGRYLFRQEPYAFWLAGAFWLSSLVNLAYLPATQGLFPALSQSAAPLFYLLYLTLLAPCLYPLRPYQKPQGKQWRRWPVALAASSLVCLAVLVGIIYLSSVLPYVTAAEKTARWLPGALPYIYGLLYVAAICQHALAFKKEQQPLMGYYLGFLIASLWIFPAIILSKEMYDASWYAAHLVRAFAYIAMYLGLLTEYLDLYRELRGALDRMSITHHLNALVSSSLDLEEIAKTLSREIQKLVPYDRLAISVRKKGADMVTVYAEESRLPSPVFPQGGPLTTEGTATGWVIDHREPLLCDDILSDQRFPITHKRYSEAGIRSYAILPLIAKGKILGALNLGSRRPRQYSQKEIAILTPLAEITSLAVENSNLYQESLRRAEIQGLLKELSQDIAFLDLDSLLKKLTEKVRQILHVDVSDLRVLEGSKWLPKGISGIDPRLISTEATGTTYGRSGWIIRQRRALAIPDITQDKGLPSGVTVRKLGLRGYLGVPLFSRDGEVIGILRALTYQPREFTQEDIDLVEQLANGAAIAIENARLFEEVQKKSEQLEALVKINRDIASLLDRETLLPSIAEDARRILNLEGASFRLIEGDDLVRAGYAGQEDLLALHPKLKLGESITGKVAQEDRIIAIKNILEESTMLEDHREILHKAGYHSFLGVPLRFADRVIGTITLFSKAEREFRPDEVNLITAFADQAAIAVENARLFEELEKSNSQLQAANKELESFSYSVSHDLRAPLRSIDGFSQSLLEDCSDRLDEQGKNYLGRVRSASQRMAQLIDDLLNLSRVSRAEMRREQVNLSGLAKTIAAELKQWEPERQVDFVIQDGLSAVGDTRLLRVVLENLLGNAWKFTSKHDRARIEFGIAQHDGARAYFVRDDGSGFDMTYTDKLFGAFQRLHSPTEFKGTGIGLATVQRIVHRHGGRIWAEGAVEQGATFYFTL